MTALCTVTCPTCFENFEVMAPAPEETPAEVDYDCEICCRPMVIRFFEEADGVISAEASGLEA